MEDKRKDLDYLEQFVKKNRDALDQESAPEFDFANIEPKDALETYIGNHREELDLHFPKEEIWENISRALQEEAKNSNSQLPKIRRMFSKHGKKMVAAIMLFALGITFTLVNRGSQDSAEFALNLSDFNPELAEVQGHYAKLINQKLLDLRTLDFQEIEEVENELRFLEKDYRKLQQEFRTNLDNEKIVQALIQNLRLQLQLLEGIEDKLKTRQINVQEKQNQGTDV